jgi:type I restriction enzyme S subunit
MRPHISFDKFNQCWKEVKLEDKTKWFSGGTPLKSNLELWKNEVPWISAASMRGIYYSSSKRNVSKSAIGKGTKLAKKGSLLLLVRGSMLFNKIPVGITTKDVTFNQDVKNIILKDGILNHYLLYWFQAKNHRLLSMVTGTGIGAGKLDTDELKALPFAYPSDNEQKEIVGFISSIDKKICLLEEKHTLLEQYKKGVMQKLFSQDIRFKDKNGNDFPDWQEKTLSQVLEIQIREVNKPSEKYLSLGIKSHMKGTFQKLNFDPESIAMDKLYIVRPNDLVVNITFAWEGAVAIAKKKDDGGLVSHRFPTYTFKDNESTHKYFKHIITLKRFKYMLDLISPGGAGRNRVLSKKEFLKLKWNLPSVEEQLKIADFLDALDKKVALVTEQIEQTKIFKKGLLQQMFV